jgi:uncharacterized membrane protein
MDSNDNKAKLEQEFNDLKQELENFQQEKERVRAIIGKIGGVPHFHNKLFNWLLVVVTILCLVISLLVSNLSVRLLMVELAAATISAKIIYLIHCQMRVNHFKVWILSSIEWRLNDLMKIVKEKKSL